LLAGIEGIPLGRNSRLQIADDATFLPHATLARQSCEKLVQCTRRLCVAFRIGGQFIEQTPQTVQPEKRPQVPTEVFF